MNMSGMTQALVFLSGVIMGTGSTITIKYIYGLEAVGLSGDLQRFEKPLSTTWVMFIAMTLALPIHYVQVWYNRRSARGINYSRIDELSDSDSVPWSTYFLLVIPACFDLMGTALAQIGLLFCTVSVYQLVRCTVIIVTALLKATVLKQKLSNYMWIGIAVNTIAMCLVSMTSFLEPVQEGSNRDARIGIIFILLSCVVQGSQYVFEEKVMTVDNAPPLIVVGMEGLWGTILMPLVVFPWAYILPGSDYGGCVENVYDAWVMTLNSTPIQITLVAFTITVWLYNIFCIYVTFLLNSIWHAILDNFRPVSVWATDLVLFYLFTNGTFGEAWTKYSWVELFGMILLFVGTAIYNGSIQLPGYSYPLVSPLEDGSSSSIEAGSMTPQIRVATPQMASPFLTRSPLVNQSIRRQKERRTSSEFQHLKNGAIPATNYGTTHAHQSSHAQATYSSSARTNKTGTTAAAPERR